MRSALLSLFLLLALAVPAFAQSPTGPAGTTAAAPVATAAQDDTADDPGTDDGSDDPGDDSTDDPGDDDTSDPGDFDDDPLDGDDDPTTCGDDGDYSYCGCSTASDYADYAYYCRPLEDAAGGGEPGTAGGVKREKAGDGAGGTVQALPASSLPYTGDRPAIVALIGLSFVMIGAGGRLRLKR